MSSLSEHLYNKAHGRIYKNSTSVTDTSWTGNGDVIATPPSGGKLCITKITFQPSAAAVATSIKSYDSAGTTAIDTLFSTVLVSGFLLTVPDVDMSDCPIILNEGETMQAIVSAGDCYVTVRGFIL